jgi:hypothetical protein
MFPGAPDNNLVYGHCLIICKEPWQDDQVEVLAAGTSSDRAAGSFCLGLRPRFFLTS